MRSAVRAYYLATPLFALLDFGFGINVRAVFVESDLLRAGYYLVPLVCGIVAWRRPGAADAIIEGRAASAVLSTRGMINVMLTGGVLAMCFYGNQSALHQRGPDI